MEITLSELEEALDKRFKTNKQELEEVLDKRFDAFGQVIDKKMDARFIAFGQEMDKKLDERFEKQSKDLKQFAVEQTENLAAMIAETVAIPLQQHIESCQKIRI